ncbi:MAG: response regulator [Candidatus Omnitrophica bacterium]|nr:response regulator [Candidatus Omnitrophota bacterium]
MPKRLLLIDDNADNRLAFAVRLKNHGFDVAVAGSGGEGLRLAEAQSHDLILIDQRMPDQKGTEVYAALRSRPSTATVPIIIFTADFPPEHWQPIAPDDPRGHIMGKPGTHVMLLRRVEEALGTAG